MCVCVGVCLCVSLFLCVCLCVTVRLCVCVCLRVSVCLCVCVLGCFASRQRFEYSFASHICATWNCMTEMPCVETHVAAWHIWSRLATFACVMARLFQNVSRMNKCDGSLTTVIEYLHCRFPFSCVQQFFEFKQSGLLYLLWRRGESNEYITRNLIKQMSETQRKCPQQRTQSRRHTSHGQSPEVFGLIMFITNVHVSELHIYS